MNPRPAFIGPKWFDTLYNLISGLGTEKDKSYHNKFAFFALDREQLDAAYRSDWIARKIIDAPAQDATREWRTWYADEPQVELLEAEERKHDIQNKLKQAIIRGRLYGGGMLVMGIKGQKADQPLDPETVGEGQLEFVHVLGRYEVNSGTRIQDPMSPNFGEPEYFEFQRSDVASTPIRVHPSRIIRFLGAELPDPNVMLADGWGDSVLQIVDDIVKAAGVCAGGIAGLVQEAKTDVLKIPRLMDSLSTSEYSNRLQDRINLANRAKSTFNILVMDGEEEWERIQVNFGTLPDVMKVYLLMASGAADIPATRLLGQSPVGLNSTGESDIRNYYDRISSDQNTDITPRLTRLDEVLIRSALGSRPKEIYFEWRPLWQPTFDEKATVGLKKAQAFKIDVDSGVLDLNVLREGRINQLIEDGTYPGIESAIEEWDGLEKDLEEEAEEVQLQMQKQLQQAPGQRQLPPPNNQQAQDYWKRRRKRKKKLSDRFDPNQPRKGKGDPEGGQWTKGAITRTREWLTSREVRNTGAALVAGIIAGELAGGDAVTIDMVYNAVQEHAETAGISLLVAKQQMVKGVEQLIKLRDKAIGAGRGFDAMSDVDPILTTLKQILAELKKLKVDDIDDDDEDELEDAFDPNQPRHPKGSPHGGKWLGHQLSVVSGPSRSMRSDPRADPQAHEIQLRGEDGTIHYRGEITEESNSLDPETGKVLWAVGFIENVSRNHKGLAADLYREMAAYAEQRGGQLVGGMQTNRLSRVVLEKLESTGYAERFVFGERELFRIFSTPKV